MHRSGRRGADALAAAIGMKAAGESKAANLAARLPQLSACNGSAACGSLPKEILRDLQC